MCKIEGCTKPKRTRGMCNAHYERWRKHGSAGTSMVKPWGTKRCSVPNCPRRHRSNGYCKLHHERWRKHGNPNIVLPALGSPRPGRLNPSWIGDLAGYHAAHVRVKAQRGRARQHNCQHCNTQAAEWAYDHADPSQRMGDDGHGNSLIYSLNPEHYIPLCVRCHRAFDVAHGAKLFGR